MSIDINAIKQKIQQLNGNYKKSKVNFWKPDVGEYRVRVLPWKANDGQPFKEKWFYYNIAKFGLLAPTQFQKPDPIQELINKLHSSGKKEDREVAKQLYPKMRAYAAVVVRGQEDQGVQVWSFGKEIYERLLGFFVDEDIGDYTNLDDGVDLKVKLVKNDKRKFLDTTVDPALKRTCLDSNPAKVEELLATMPDLDDYFKLESYDVIKQKLDEWVNGGHVSAQETVGHVHPTSPKAAEPDELDKLVEEVAEVKTAAPAKAAVKKSEQVSESTVKSSAKKKSPALDLDSVFDEIMNDED